MQPDRGRRRAVRDVGRLEEAARAGRPYTHLGYNRFLDPEGYPAVKPPWGTLNAIDLDQGVIRWSVRLGELRQYVVIAAGGGKMGTKSGDAYVAFALPD